eukprot:Sspe_Gene.56005::Locus_30815_Transcript_1_1_Confidence_1.000_Length_2161::g.56005::m.56005
MVNVPWIFWMDTTIEDKGSSYEYLGQADSMKSFWKLWNCHQLDQLGPRETFSFIQLGVDPSPDHPSNRKGGLLKASFKSRVKLPHMWVNVTMYVTGRQHKEGIVGAGCSKRSIVLWLKDASDEALKEELRRELPFPDDCTLSLKAHSDSCDADGSAAATKAASLAFRRSNSCPESMTPPTEEPMPSARRVGRMVSFSGAPESEFCAEGSSAGGSAGGSFGRPRAFTEAYRAARDCLFPFAAVGDDDSVALSRNKSSTKCLRKRSRAQSLKKVLSADDFEEFIPDHPINHVGTTEEAMLKRITSWADDDDWSSSPESPELKAAEPPRVGPNHMTHDAYNVNGSLNLSPERQASLLHEVSLPGAGSPPLLPQQHPQYIPAYSQSQSPYATSPTIMPTSPDGRYQQSTHGLPQTQQIRLPVTSAGPNPHARPFMPISHAAQSSPQLQPAVTSPPCHPNQSPSGVMCPPSMHSQMHMLPIQDLPGSGLTVGMPGMTSPTGMTSPPQVQSPVPVMSGGKRPMYIDPSAPVAPSPVLNHNPYSYAPSSPTGCVSPTPMSHSNMPFNIIPNGATSPTTNALQAPTTAQNGVFMGQELQAILNFVQVTGISTGNIGAPPDTSQDQAKYSKSRSPRNRRKIRERKIREAADSTRREMDIWAPLFRVPSDSWISCMDNKVMFRPD